MFRKLLFLNYSQILFSLLSSPFWKPFSKNIRTQTHISEGPLWPSRGTLLLLPFLTWGINTLRHVSEDTVDFQAIFLLPFIACELKDSSIYTHMNQSSWICLKSLNTEKILMWLSIMKADQTNISVLVSPWPFISVSLFNFSIYFSISHFNYIAIIIHFSMLLDMLHQE